MTDGPLGTGGRAADARWLVFDDEADGFDAAGSCSAGGMGAETPCLRCGPEAHAATEGELRADLQAGGVPDFSDAASFSSS